MYVRPNFKTKRDLKLALAQGKHVEVFQPNGDLRPNGNVIPQNGTVSVEGPHYPEPHKWYAQLTLKDGKIVKVK